MNDTYLAIQKAQAGDKEALDQLVEQNLNLVRSVAGRFSGFHCEWDDLFQLGCIGLVKAVQRFNPSFKVKFSTYAVPMIIGEIKRFLRDDNAVKISRELKSLGFKLRRKNEELSIALGREPTLKEVAEAIGVTPQEAAAALEAARPLKSLYEPLVNGKGDETLLIDQLAAGNRLPAADRLMLEEGMRKLSEVERRVIELRFFADKTQSESARELCVSQVQVSRLERRAVEKLRTFFSK